MPVGTADMFTGLGVPAQLADFLGANPNLQNGTGTAQTGATVIHSRNTELNPQSGATAYIFPSTAEIMVPYFLNNQQTATALVFVPSGHYLNNSQNSDLTIATGASAIVWQYKKSYWTYK
jgi:hypothetical protein